MLPIPPGDERYPNLEVIIPETGFTVSFIPLILDAFVIFVDAVDFETVLDLFALANFISFCFAFFIENM